MPRFEFDPTQERLISVPLRGKETKEIIVKGIVSTNPEDPKMWLIDTGSERVIMTAEQLFASEKRCKDVRNGVAGVHKDPIDFIWDEIAYRGLIQFVDEFREAYGLRR